MYGSFNFFLVIIAIEILKTRGFMKTESKLQEINLPELSEEELKELTGGATTIIPEDVPL